MSGKVKETDMNERIHENLKIMDSLLEIRKVEVSGIEATKSTEALIAYINQNSCGKWVINNYSHLSATDKMDFIKGMNKVLPYIKNKDAFIERIKYSMKNNMCKTIDFDCYINDFMCGSESECVLTDEGYSEIQNKYKKEIEEFINDIKEQWSENETEYNESDLDLEDKLTLRFEEGK